MSEEKKDSELKPEEAAKTNEIPSADEKKEADSSAAISRDDAQKQSPDKPSSTAPSEASTGASEAENVQSPASGDEAPAAAAKPANSDSAKPDGDAAPAASSADAEKEAKIKAAAEAREARARERAAKAAEAGEGGAEAAAPAASGGDADAEKEAKIKAAAEAREARARERAARAAEAGEGGAEAAPPAASGGDADAEKEAKVKAAAEARAARARERAAKTGEGADAAPAAPKEPSPKQPVLDRLVQLLKDHVAEDAVEEASINERGGHRPTIVVKGDHWPAAAELLKSSPELDLNYLRNLSGVDMETHLEVVYHLISLNSKEEYTVKVKTNRDEPTVPSVTPIWSTANWNEREVYDLFGIDFPGHPDLRRIMMSDEWVGHPLRKDYEPLDPEV
ncbi:NADH-quinone oxidoreductase subunit C [Paenibacillus contaminans]|uniref:NADH-quinone oxidoreductase subunit C n=1 Tax=Paenibacillus contaminans TaxID=450362 RepID=A0A329MDI3_9BACL|nr:NADH-quinone oxidoreductase subunit C [Paenibacillus contaminans]RAV17356.1 protein NuoC [Paenibacillus contaminans]